MFFSCVCWWWCHSPVFQYWNECWHLLCTTINPPPSWFSCATLRRWWEGSRTGTCDLYGIFFSNIKCRLHDTKWKSNISIYFSDMGIFHKLEKTGSHPHCLLLAVSFGKGEEGTSHLSSLGQCSHLEHQGSWLCDCWAYKSWNL